MSETTTSPPRKKFSSTNTGNEKALGGDDPAAVRSRQFLRAMLAFRDGDFSVRLPADWPGVDGRIAEAFNQSLAHEGRISREVARLSVTVGKEGRLKQRMTLPGAVGEWAEKVDSINTLLDDLVRPEVARTIGAVAKGDLGQSMDLEVDGRPLKGEFLRSAKLVNTMIEQLSVFTSEVTALLARLVPRASLEGRQRSEASREYGRNSLNQSTRWPAI